MDFNRVYIFKIFLIIICSIIIIKLFYIQVIEDKYEISALNNSVRVNTLYPSRGEILDRNGLLLAQSKEAYDLYVIPRDVKAFDTTSLCNILNVDKYILDSLFQKAKSYSYRKASLLFSQLEHRKKLMIDEMNISGLHVEYRSVRSYPYNTAGNILGYVSNVTQGDLRKDDFYDRNDYIGKTGIERVYEFFLRGEKGQSLKVVDVHGTVVDNYNDGAEDFAPTTGSTITTTIDLRIQKLGEELMKNKIGAVVAIEPASGEILAMISSPTYNPDLLIGESRSKAYSALLNDPRQPLYNRTAMGAYPPGSTFKTAVALSALKYDIVDYNTMFSCSNGFHYGGRTLGCHSHYSPLSMEFAIQTSCNSYFCNVFVQMLNSPQFSSRAEALDTWAKQMNLMGFGVNLNSDVSGELSGLIPTSKYYNFYYPRNTWNAYTILSVSIGQGEILSTPLQLANFASLIANRGYYITPHLLKKVGGVAQKDERLTEKHESTIEKRHFDFVVDAMWKGVNQAGTGAVARVNGLDICGKTGTAENGFGKDHSTFMALAPRENPQIAIVVYVENGGFGATVAAPIASLLIEKYMTDSISRPELMTKMLDMKIDYPHYDKKEQK